MTRAPIDTKDHYSTWTWRWICDRIGCKTVDTITASKHKLPSVEEMVARGWFVAKVWGDRCPACVAAGLVGDTEPHPMRITAEDVAVAGDVL